LLPGKLKVHIAIEVLYQYRIPSVSAQDQDKLKQAIETMTGLSDEQVNIRIAGVRVSDARKTG
ncbi:Asp23/Gls24 family envelope stress response protein, partial [Coprococcus eutactus]|uniref:Asp23/Gls24 family envelope stress response protein n=1 Tax=Coprococcus eutactus TaxID=33043 RepID=UPI002109FE67